MTAKKDKFQVDFLGQEVRIGDYVVSTVPYIRGIALARVHKITPKGITVEYLIEGQKKMATRSGNNYARVDPEDALAAVLMVGLDH